MTSCVLISYTYGESQNGKTLWHVLIVIFVVLYVFGFQLGMGPIPLLLSSELCPMSHRTQILGLDIMVNTGASSIVSLCFPVVRKAINEAAFFIFVAAVGLGGIFVAWKVPDTKGKRPDLIQEILQGPSDQLLRQEKASIQEGSSNLQQPTKI